MNKFHHTCTPPREWVVSHMYAWVMSHIYEWVMSHVYECAICYACMNESCRTYLNMSCQTYINVSVVSHKPVSTQNESSLFLYTPKKKKIEYTHMSVVSQIHKWVMSHIQISNVSHCPDCGSAVRALLESCRNLCTRAAHGQCTPLCLATWGGFG